MFLLLISKYSEILNTMNLSEETFHIYQKLEAMFNLPKPCISCISLSLSVCSIYVTKDINIQFPYNNELRNVLQMIR